MSTYTQIYYHLVFSTRDRQPVLRTDFKEDLLRYIWGIVKNRNCYLHRINSVPDHLHMLIDLHPTVDLASLVRDMKTSTTLWIRQKLQIARFPGWQDGYGAFTKSHQERDMIIEYIKNQEEHHKRVSFVDELKNLLMQEGIEYDERYLV